MLLLWLLASFVFMAGYEMNATYIVPHIRDWFYMPRPHGKIKWFMEYFSLFSQINMEGCIAASIKLGKLWYVKQQEIDLLKQEREKIHPNVDEGKIHPAFLADLLTRLEALADRKPVVVAKSIKQVRSLFINLLYENARANVLLKNEISLLEEYIYLEQLTADENMQVQTFINAAPTTETIAPFILLPIVENAFKQVLMLPMIKKVVIIKVDLDQGVLVVHLEWNKPLDTSTFANGRNIILQNISKRLQLFYPQSHSLKIYIQVEKIIVHLRVDLKKAIN